MATIQYTPMPLLSEREVMLFKNKVKHGGDDECWEWTACKLPKGYGKLTVSGNRSLLAHRAAYFIATGIDPLEKQVCHKCDNPPCCNPHHFFLGSNHDNVLDMTAKGRGTKGRKVKNPSKIKRGYSHYAASHHLSEIDIYFMREMYASDMYSQKRIAESYGVQRPNLWNILKNKTWKFVPMPDGIIHSGNRSYSDFKYR